MLGKRQMTSEAPLPSAAKQARQESPGNKAHATSPGVKAAAFLTSCAFCGKGLGPGMDTYIYRGEVAFCSHECRERHIQLMDHDCSLSNIGTAPEQSAHIS
ncbi:hypothetical protein QYE76_026341 [Lolium multiflorum]|uniref:FLZ-type domain-containing protein n=1 Tax=Lolium multiflorum TaxID=4521 RepID=A0AAD8VVI1_LOLMU|nr:hypothetical protein QYE76_026341 [Lolium multiflorum]